MPNGQALSHCSFNSDSVVGLAQVGMAPVFLMLTHLFMMFARFTERHVYTCSRAHN